MASLLRRIDLTSLRLFVAVCQERNIARAAERECIVPSAISRRITEIEGIIGLAVIQRESRGISVTPAGETVLRHAQAVLASIERMGADLSRFDQGLKGRVRVVANMSAIVEFLPEDIAAFKRMFPDIDVELDERTSEGVMRSVEGLDFDLGICNNTAGIERLEHLPYRSGRLLLMVPREHRLESRAAVRLRDFVDESFVGLGDKTALSCLMAREAVALGRQLDVKIRVGSLDALCRMVHVRLGIAVVPQHVGELYVNTLDVMLLPIDEPWARRELKIVLRQREGLSAAATSLVDFLTSCQRSHG